MAGQWDFFFLKLPHESNMQPGSSGILITSALSYLVEFHANVAATTQFWGSCFSAGCSCSQFAWCRPQTHQFLLWRIQKYLRRQTSLVFNQATNTSWLTLITSWTLDPVYTLLITSWLENQFLTCGDPFAPWLGLEFHILRAPPWSETGRSWLLLWFLGLSLLTFTLIAPSLLSVYNL